MINKHSFSKRKYVAVGLLLISGPLYALDMVVSWSGPGSDSIDTNLGNGYCDGMMGDCSLRAAIMEINHRETTNPGETHTITFSSTPKTLSISGRNENDAATGDLDIKANVTIDGGANGRTIDGGAVDRVFHIHSGFNVTLKNLTITNGDPECNDGSTTRYGGGVQSEGNLTLENVTITGNTISSPFTCGTLADPEYGGGLEWHVS